MTPSDQDDILLAGELALGLLEGPALSAAEARALADPAFAALVEGWAVRLAPMLTGAAVEPPATVWQGIAARLAANDDAFPHQASSAVKGWRITAIGASALAASLAIMLVARPAPEAAPIAVPAQPVLVAALQDEKSASAVTISVEGGQLLVTPVRLLVDGQAPELWVIPEDGTPRSLGLVRAAAPSRLAVPKQHQPHIHQGATFAISLEPAGGSPTGAPTGPIAASGILNRI